MKTSFKRSITGFIYVVVLITAIALNSYTFALLFSAIMTLAIIEISKILSAKGIKIQLYTCIIISELSFLFAFLYWGHDLLQAVYISYIPVLVPLVFLPAVFIHRKNQLLNTAFTFFTFIYISLPFILLNYFVFHHQGVYDPYILLGYFFIIWIYDTGAYITGLWIGKRPFLPHISPKKTWEGTTGGIILAMILSFILPLIFTELSKIQWLVFSLITITGSIMGDLSESLIKRTAGVKDSGKILPGHGGILDRIDSVLLSSPLVFVYLYVVI